MTETRRTSFFALLFFIYFIGVSFLMAYLPLASRLSDSAYMLLSQLICFVPPLLVYFKWSKKNVKETLRLNPLGWKNLLLLLSFGISIQPLMSLLSYLTALFFPNPVEQSVGGIQSSGFLVSFVAVAVLPAVFEECFSRGILLSGYHFLGKYKAQFACALLFGLLHLNPQQFPYAFIVGFIFAFLVDRTNSIFASILPHMIINGTTIFSIFATSSETMTTAAAELPQGSVLASLLVVSLLSLPWLAALLYLFLKANPPREELLLLDENGSPYRERFLSPAIITICVRTFALYHGMKKGAFGSFQTVDKVILRQRKGLGNKLFITLLRKAGFACRPFLGGK